MKLKYLATAALVACAGFVAQAAKTPQELRVYINPGHGSWTGNDRPMQAIGKPEYSATNTDTTGFFESNTDLIKGFGMLEKLIEMGMPFDRTRNQTGERWEIGAARDLTQNIVMSRVKNGPFEANNTTSSPNYMLYNRALLEIATEVEHNEFDIFVSIHSNAASIGSTTNYHLMMYRGHNGKENVLAPGSWEMAEAASKYSFANAHAAWSANYTYINGDIDFMTSDKKGTYNELGYYGYLGVLKHGTPGYLVEGYFHTYLPAMHRGMNFDVDFIEGCQYARGVAEYFEFDKRDASGEIYGIVRDRHERFAHKLYKPNPATDDIYKPLNGVKAILKQDGNTVAEYTTDEFYNGAFVFKGLTPGTYTVEVQHPDYKDEDPIEVVVKAGATTYPKLFIEAVDYVEPDNVAVNYPDPAAKYGALSATESYEVADLIADVEIPGLEGKTVRRAIARDGRLYILALDKPITYAAAIPVDEQAKATILVYDVNKKEVVATVSTEGAAGSIAAISDIQLTADGILLACNATKNQYDSNNIQSGDAGRGTFYIYKWENDKNGLPTGNPASWISTQYSGLWYRAYPTRFVYSGTTEEGKFVIPMPTITGPSDSNPGYTTRAVAGTVLEGNPQVVDGIKPSVAYYTGAAGADLNLFASPLSEDEALVIDSKNKIGSWNFNTPYEFIERGNDLLNGVNGASSLMRYAGHSYLVKAMADGTLEVVDITDGLAKATATGISFATAPAAGEYASVATAGETLAERDEITGAVTNAWFNLYLLRDGHLTAYTTKGMAKADTFAPMAYALKQNVEKDDTGKDKISFEFKVTADVPSAALVFTNVNDAEEVIEYEIGAVEANTLTVVDSEPFRDMLIHNAYNWAVKVTGNPVNVAGTYFTDATASRTANSRGGVVAFSDPEDAATVGMVAVSHSYAAGFDVFAADGSKTASNVHKGAPFVTAKINSAIRGGEFCGRAVFIDWSDANAGIYALDPMDPEATMIQMFAGDRNNMGGYVYDGKIIGGGGSGVAFQRNKDNFYMYTFEEDLELIKANGDNLLVRYTIPADEFTITAGPDETFGQQYSGSSLLTSTNVDIDPFPGGFIVSQITAENSESKPGFIICDESGKKLFSSDTLADLLNCASGVALSKDRTTIAAQGHDGIHVYKVTWAEDGTPELAFQYLVPGTADTWGDLAFDIAGNVHTYTLSRGYEAIALTNPAPVAVTPAPVADVVKFATSIADVELDTNAPVEFFNLQGVRVAADALTPGIYIRRQGNVADKVVIR